jgi:hypothetical protein
MQVPNLHFYTAWPKSLRSMSTIVETIQRFTLRRSEHLSLWMFTVVQRRHKRQDQRINCISALLLGLMFCMVDGAAPAQHAADTQPLRTLYKAFYRGRRLVKETPENTYISRFNTLWADRGPTLRAATISSMTALHSSRRTRVLSSTVSCRGAPRFPARCGRGCHLRCRSLQVSPCAASRQ